MLFYSQIFAALSKFAANGWTPQTFYVLQQEWEELFLRELDFNDLTATTIPSSIPTFAGPVNISYVTWTDWVLAGQDANLAPVQISGDYGQSSPAPSPPGNLSALTNLLTTSHDADPAVAAKTHLIP